jgi:DhnA family fructose-bisphosphate aldolase class Ia
MYNWGKSRKLAKLKKNNYYLILALDHALTKGPILGINNIEEMNNLISFSEKNNLPAIVLNYGYISKLSVFNKINIITQTMGLPDKELIKTNKIPLVNIDSLPSIDTTAISVQINFTSDDFQNYIYNIAGIVNEANKYDYPILFMIGDNDWKSIDDFNYAIRICCELGADLIKIRLPSSSKIIKKIDKFSLQHTPILLSGGEKDNNFKKNLTIAKQLGFQGVCIGRNIFQSKNPLNVLNLIDKVFKYD